MNKFFFEGIRKNRFPTSFESRWYQKCPALDFEILVELDFILSFAQPLSSERKPHHKTHTGPHHMTHPPLPCNTPTPHHTETYPLDKSFPSERKSYYTGHSPLWLKAQLRPNFWYWPNIIYKCPTAVLGCTWPMSCRLDTPASMCACCDTKRRSSFLLVTEVCRFFFFFLIPNVIESTHSRLGWGREKSDMLQIYKISAENFFRVSCCMFLVGTCIGTRGVRKEERKRKESWQRSSLNAATLLIRWPFTQTLGFPSSRLPHHLSWDLCSEPCWLPKLCYPMLIITRLQYLSLSKNPQIPDSLVLL